MKKSSLNKNKTDNAASRYPRDETISMILLLFFMFISIQTQAQKEDYNWIFGDDYIENGRNIFNFENEELKIDTVNTEMQFSFSNASISDSLGNLLLYTNGLKIFEASTNQLIENGDSINYSTFWIDFNNNFGSYRAQQNSLILPSLSEKEGYSLFSLRVDTILNYNLDYYEKAATNLLLTNIIKNSNKFVVSSKNNKIIVDTLAIGMLTSCRHANGRDWWIVCQEVFTNCVNVLLYSPDTLYLFNKNCTGVDYTNLEVGFANFSNDGSKLIMAGGISGLKIFDFDRCSGQLALKEYISRDDLMSPSDPIESWLGNNAISSNSRFLYTGPFDSLYQFDLHSPDILSSKQLVFGRDPNATTIYSFVNLNLASDGKIYVSTPSVPFYHVITAPDTENTTEIELMLSLKKIGSPSFGNFPNYRLGRLIGSPCDTLYNSVSELDALDVLAAYPNPANDNIRIEYAGKFWEQVNNLHLKITNVLGQEYFYKKLPEYSAWQNINLTNYPKGIYFVYLMDQGKVLGTLRFVKR